MLSPSPAPIPADRRRDRVAAGLALAAHVLVMAVLLALPERAPSREDLDVRVIELLPADYEPPAPAQEPPPAEEPPPEPTPVEVPAEPDEPGPDEAEPSAAPDSPPDAPTEPPEAPQPAEPTPAPPPAELPTAPTLPDDEQKAPGLALLGLRQPSEAPGSALAPRVRWSPSMAGGPRGAGPGGGGGGRGPADTAAMQPQPMIQGKPRTLEEAGFIQRRNGALVYKDPERRFNATLHPDGRITFRNRIGTPFAAMPGMTEVLRDASDQELYRIEKRRLIEATEELRMAYAARNAQRNVTEQLSGLERQLDTIWKRASLSAEQRRALLFERWDECEELEPRKSEEGAEMDDMRKKAGAVARRKIEAYIRRTLPPGSPDAYSEAELRALNANRTSKQPFSPYRDG